MANVPHAAKATIPGARTPSLFEFVALNGLPCGCVAAAFRAKPWDMTLVSIEAKGPHCVHAGHHQARVLEFGVMPDLFGGYGEE